MSTNATAERKRELLTQYAELLPRPRFMVETGLYQGYGSGMGLLDAGVIDRYLAIDCQEENVKLARERGYDAVLGDSAYELLPALRNLSDPALVWLDAHGIPDGEPDVDFPPCPLLDELDDLRSLPVTHYVLIDDLHMFGSMHAEHDWPSLETVRHEVDRARRWRRDELEGIMILTPRGDDGEADAD